ncbi:MAG: hypothetical protein AB7J28_05480 [Hyphomonadaceae bacterium]
MRIAPVIAAVGLFLVGAPAGTLALAEFMSAVSGSAAPSFDAAAQEPQGGEPAPAPAVPDNSAPPQEHLAHIVEVELFRENRCPGEQQSVVILERVTAGWDYDAVASALQIVSGSNDLCPPVAAALERVRDAAEIAAVAAGEDGDPTTIGGEGPPGGNGGPLYLGS